MIERAIIDVPADDAGEWKQLVLDGTEIDRLCLFGAITVEQCAGARRWYADWYRSGLEGRGASLREGAGRTLPANPFERMSEREEGAWKAYSDALMAIPSGWPRVTTRAVVVLDIPCKNLVALRAGLDALAKFYDRRR